MWKYVLIGIVAFVGLIYASPILFPSDHAIQITPQGKFVVDDKVLQRLNTQFKEKGIVVKKVDVENNSALYRFNDAATQLKAIDIVRQTLGEENYVSALNLAATTPSWLRALNANPMYMGLDLRGGVHFLMEVDMEAALKKALNNYKESFRNELINNKIKYKGIAVIDGHLEVLFSDKATFDHGLKVISSLANNELILKEEVTEKNAVKLIATMKEATLKAKKSFALKQNITTLRNRVNELGVAEPVIQQQGLDRIIVQLPGIQDTARAKNILGATATLEFHKVDIENSATSAKQSGVVPSGDKLFSDADGNPVLLKRRTIIEGDSITNASAGYDSQSNSPMVSLSLDSKGGNRMLKFTSENVQQYMGVVFVETKAIPVMVDGVRKLNKKTTKKVINQAQVREPFGSRFQITGLDSTEEAHNLALLLRAGALAAPVYIVEERTIGPSLGAANVDAGFKSVALGFVLVLIFMALYYRVFGLVANLALALNLVLIVAVLSMMQATLTLPGIAGIVLTVGMAVDANVLIYERIKEELKNGLSPQAAIDSGYAKAFSTIADANITTLIAATVLFTFGTGPIKGFAITLAIGILSSMFTAIMGTRAVINSIYGNRKVEKLAI
jgi:preprotein translocase subunit SecD